MVKFSAKLKSAKMAITPTKRHNTAFFNLCSRQNALPPQRVQSCLTAPPNSHDRPWQLKGIGSPYLKRNAFFDRKSASFARKKYFLEESYLSEENWTSPHKDLNQSFHLLSLLLLEQHVLGLLLGALCFGSVVCCTECGSNWSMDLCNNFFHLCWNLCWSLWTGELSSLLFLALFLNSSCPFRAIGETLLPVAT